MRKSILLTALSLSALYGFLGCADIDDSEDSDETSHDTKEAVIGCSSGAGGGTTGTGSSGGGTCNYPNWVQSKQYYTGDIVLYNGSPYIATHDNPGYIPTVSTWFWSPSTVCSGGSGSTSGAGGSTSGSGGSTSGAGGSTSGSGGSGGAGGGSSTGKWVSGYYVGYQQNLYPTSEIDWSGLTHLFVGRVVPNSNGTLNTTFDIDATNGPILAKKLVQLAHQNGKKAVVMLGGAGALSAWQGAASAQNRGAFVQNLKQLAQDYGFDGFDLDWEPLSGGDQPAFKALAQALRAAMPSTLLAVPVGWVGMNNSNVGSFYGDIAPLFDQINIMSYGMAGGWPGWQSWHTAALYGESSTTPTSIDATVKAYLSAGVPAAKLGIGIAFYGECWSSPVTQPKSNLNGSSVVANDNVMSYDNIMKSYYSDANYHWDATARMPYLGFSSAKGPQGCTFVSYEDSQSIIEKGTYVKQKGLGGAIVWTINQGHRPSQPAGQKEPLMQALKQGFLQ
jgi:chitinase